MRISSFVNIFVANSFTGAKTTFVKQESPVTFRIEPELHQRLEECSKRLRIKKYTLALLALEAAIDAVEKNDYHIALPIQFEVTHLVTKKESTDRVPEKPLPIKYPPHREEIMRTEDKPPSSQAERDLQKEVAKQIWGAGGRKPRKQP